MSSTLMGSKAGDAYSSVGLTSEVYAVVHFTSLVHSPRFLCRNPSVLNALAATVSTCLCQPRSLLMVLTVTHYSVLNSLYVL